MITTETVKAVAFSDTTWAAYDQLVAAGSVPDRGGRHHQALTDQARDSGRIPADASVRLYLGLSAADTQQLVHELVAASLRQP